MTTEPLKWWVEVRGSTTYLSVHNVEAHHIEILTLDADELGGLIATLTTARNVIGKAEVISSLEKANSTLARNSVATDNGEVRLSSRSWQRESR